MNALNQNTPTMKIEINPNILIGMLSLSSKDSTRFVIHQTVHFEVTDKECIIVATDGRSMGIALAGLVMEPPKQNPAHATVAINGAMLKALRKNVRGCVTLEFYERKVTFLSRSASFTQDLVEGTYPHWRTVLPTTEQTAPIDPCFNWELLANFVKAGNTISGCKDGTIRLYQDKDVNTPMLVLLPRVHNFIGLIMPMRFADTVRVPDWAREKAPVIPAQEPTPAPATT